jgi:copper chaperone CopZ
LGPTAAGQGLNMRTILRVNLPSIHAIRAVETALQAVEGITRAEVSRSGLTLEHDGRATKDALTAAVENAGFEVKDVVEEGRRLPVRDD